MGQPCPPPGWATGSEGGNRREHPLSAALDFALDHEGALGGVVCVSLEWKGAVGAPRKDTHLHRAGCRGLGVFWGVTELCADPDRCGGTPGQ